jgi:hypothetical protein
VTRPAAADRTARLVAARQDAARGTQKRTLKAIEEMRSRQDRISFAAVQRAAGVSTWFVYNNRQVRAAIEEAIALQTPNQAKPRHRRVVMTGRCRGCAATSSTRGTRSARCAPSAIASGSGYSVFLETRSLTSRCRKRLNASANSSSRISNSRRSSSLSSASAAPCPGRSQRSKTN